jgi:hypothetical protein
LRTRILLKMAGKLVVGLLALHAPNARGTAPAMQPDLSAPVLCEDKPGGPAWLDRMQAEVYRKVCLSAARFDSLFGDARFRDEYQATHGSVSVGAKWSEHDRLTDALRFRVHVQLPQLSERLDAFVGKDDSEEDRMELRDDFDTLPRRFGRHEDDAVLVGLGYRQPAFGGGSFDLGVGAALDSGVDPYLKGRYRVVLPFLERNVLRLRETLFWQDGEGFGVTTRVDLERLLAQRFLARWTGSTTLTQNSHGVRWFSSATLYQNIGAGRALAYQVGASGELDDDVPIADYGLRIVYRRRVLREWLFLELRSSITWPRETQHEPRERNLGAGVALEMSFGDPRASAMR